MIYANLSYPIYKSATGFTCSGDAVLPFVQAPNGNRDADTEISPTSHEIMESITDPDTGTGWYDSSGFENGDECAYVFGQTSGTPGQRYNQVINGHHYVTQEVQQPRLLQHRSGLPAERVTTAEVTGYHP